MFTKVLFIKNGFINEKQKLQEIIYIIKLSFYSDITNELMPQQSPLILTFTLGKSLVSILLWTKISKKLLIFQEKLRILGGKNTLLKIAPKMDLGRSLTDKTISYTV